MMDSYRPFCDVFATGSVIVDGHRAAGASQVSRAERMRSCLGIWLPDAVRAPYQALFLFAAGVVLIAIAATVPKTVWADQSDGRLDGLFQQLMQAPDVYAAAAVEGQIWQIWLDAGNAEVNRLLGQGVEAMNAGDLQRAIAWFDQVVENAPAFAEGWNKRATVHFLANQLEASMADIRQTLILEPRHFGAISGLGLIFLRIGNEASALRVFREVLKIHPQSPSAKAHVRELATKLGEKGA